MKKTQVDWELNINPFDEYKIETKIGDAEGKFILTHIDLCKYNGVLSLGSIPSKFEILNCKETISIFYTNFYRRGNNDWKVERNEVRDTFEKCHHDEECRVAVKENKKNFAEFDSPQPGSVSGSNNRVTNIYNTVTGDDNSLPGGNAVGRDLGQRQEMWSQLGPLFALAFFVLLLAVFIAQIIVCLK